VQQVKVNIPRTQLTTGETNGNNEILTIISKNIERVFELFFRSSFPYILLHFYKCTKLFYYAIVDSM